MANTKLAVIWSSGDPAVAHKICFMYTHNAKRRGWFDEVTLIVWGPSAELLTRDPALQDKIKEMLADGVAIEACKACSDAYGVSERLSALGIDVKYMGTPLTEMLQSDWKVLTF
ncbi:MAG: DsrE family protein [Anaerolineae bacterium]|nr:DsrE family protein [Anaerolineae bacterium]